MAAPKPKSKASEVLEILSRYLDGTKPDQLTLARLHKMAKESLKNEPLEAYVALGAVAAYNWDDAATDHYYSNALRLANRADIFANYSVSLTLLERMSEAADMANKASELSPADLDLLRASIGRKAWAGRFGDSLELVHQYNLKSPKRRLNSASRIEDAARILEKNNVPMSVVEKSHDIAYGLIRKKRTSSVGFRLEPLFEENLLMAYICLDLSLEEVMDIDAEFTNILFEEIDNLYLANFWIGFEKATTDDNSTPFS